MRRSTSVFGGERLAAIGLCVAGFLLSTPLPARTGQRPDGPSPRLRAGSPSTAVLWKHRPDRRRFEIDAVGYEASVPDVLGGNASLTYRRGDHHLSITPSDLAWVGAGDRRVLLKRGVNEVEARMVPEPTELDGARRSGRGVLFENALGEGAHLELLASERVFSKIVRFDTEESLGTIPDGVDELEIRFEIATEADTRFEARFGGSRLREWDRRRRALARDEPVTFGRGASSSVIRPARAWDSAGEEIPIALELSSENGRLFLSKRIPRSWLERAAFPVYCDFDLTLGPSSVFQATATSDQEVVALDSTRIVVAYLDGGTGFGMAAVGTVSGDTVSFGTPATFNATATLYMSMTAVDSSHVAISYVTGNIVSGAGSAIIGTVSGNAISFGAPTNFNPGYSQHTSIAALDATNVLIAYQDYAGSNAWAIVGTISGGALTYGAPAQFAAATISYVSTVTLLSSKAVIAYDLTGGPGSAVVATISGTSVSFGTPVVFNAADSWYVSADALDSSRVVIAYRDLGNADFGTSVVGTVSGTSISFASTAIFSPQWSNSTVVTALDSSHVAIAYERVWCSPKPCEVLDYGTVIVGTVSGTSITYGSPYIYGDENSAPGAEIVSITSLDQSHVALAFSEDTNSDKGTARIGSILPSVRKLIGFETGDALEIAALSAGGSVQNVTVRPGSGSYCLKEGSTSTITQNLSPALEKMGLRLSFRKPIDPGAPQTLVQLRNGATNLWALELRSDGLLQVRQDQAIGLTGTPMGTTLLPDNRWVTLRLVYDASAGGVLRVWLDSSLEVNATHTSAGSAVTDVLVSGMANPNEFFYDDFLLNDSLSAPPPGQIVRIGPNAVGSSTQFDTVSGSATHYLNVDELSPNGDTDFNQHSGSSYATDVYGLEPAPAAAINAVKPMWQIKRGSGPAGTGSHNHAWAESASAKSLPFDTVTTAWQVLERVWSAPPQSGGTWTSAKVDGLELGAAHNGTQGQDTFLSWTVAMVDYDNGTTSVSLISFTARGLDGGVLLEWETGSERNNLGFHLYRSTSEEGPYARITPSLVPGLGSSPEGAKYSYRDRGLDNGVTYYYELEDVETTGKSERHGPAAATPEVGSGSDSEDESSRIAIGEPREPELLVFSQGPEELVLELVTPGFYAEPLDDGSVRVAIPGLAMTEEEGAPSLPLKRTWVPVRAGRGVRLVSVETLEEEPFDHFLPETRDAAVIEASRKTARIVPARRARGKRDVTGSYPPRVAELRETAFQGETKKALIEIAPLRWDAVHQRLVLAHRVVVRLSLHGRERAERASNGSRGRRDRRRPSHEQRSVFARLGTREAGLYGVRFEELFGESGRPLVADSLRLSRQGATVAFYLREDVFGPGATLYFVSEGEKANPYGDQAVYELETGASGERIARQTAAPSGPPTAFYWERVEREEQRLYQAALVRAPDRWLWTTLFAPVRESFPFQVSDLGTANEPARLSLWLQGVSDFPADPDHHIRVCVNDVFASETSWNGKESRRIDVELQPTDLREGENLLEIENVGDTEAPYSMVMLDRFEVSYPRRLRARDGRLEGLWSQSGTAQIDGIKDGIVIETSDGGRSGWLEGTTPTPSGIAFHAEAGSTYLAVSREAVRSAVVTIPPHTNDLKQRKHRADYLAIGPRAFLEAAVPLLRIRLRQGLLVEAVAVEDVFSEFGFGEENPRAIQDFLAYAYHNWAVAPRYVVLLGDATYDFKNYLGTGVKNRVPPLMVMTSYVETASDPAYAAVNGDDLLPDLAIGRLPAATREELQAMVAKIVDFETSERSLEGRVVLVTDNPDAAGDFVADAEAVAGTMLQGREVEKIHLSELGPAVTRDEIRRAFDQGSSIMSYMGHGGIQLWADEDIFDIGDVASLSPQPEQPVLLTMDCLNGYFHFPYFNALAEEVVKAKGKGAIAAFSPSGFSLHDAARPYYRALMEELLHGGHLRLGDAVLAAQSRYADSGALPEMLAIYHLFGDPAMRIAPAR